MKRLLFFQYVLVYVAYELTCVIFIVPMYTTHIEEDRSCFFFLFCFSDRNAYDVTLFFFTFTIFKMCAPFD